MLDTHPDDGLLDATPEDGRCCCCCCCCCCCAAATEVDDDHDGTMFILLERSPGGTGAFPPLADDAFEDDR